MSLGSSSRGGQRIRLVVIHTAEGSRTKESLYNFFNGNGDASSHTGIDGYGQGGDWVPDELAAWTLLNGNPISLNAELCGFARWGRDQWLSEGVVDGVVNPRAMIRHSAQWAKAKCVRWGIPLVKLGPGDVDAGRAGIIGHADWSYSAIGQGDHTDPGPNFPWDVFFSDMDAPYSGGGSGAGPAPAPAKPAVDFPLPAGHYFGDVNGPDESHGGYYAQETTWVRQVQTALQRVGAAPNVAGWADGRWEQPTTDAMRKWEASVGRAQDGRCDVSDWNVLVKGQSAPAPVPAPPANTGGAGAFPLPSGHYFGLVTGPNESHGGYYVSERPYIKRIQQALIRKGYVPGVSDPNSGWADGVFEQPTADAVARFQRAEMPGTTFFGQVWWDDWAKLLG